MNCFAHIATNSDAQIDTTKIIVSTKLCVEPLKRISRRTHVFFIIIRLSEKEAEQRTLFQLSFHKTLHFSRILFLPTNNAQCYCSLRYFTVTVHSNANRVSSCFFYDRKKFHTNENQARQWNGEWERWMRRMRPAVNVRLL
ncbi:hypothetical protein D917_08267 [Trichinella nativa]|uniref:Uncharacterized protein n=1 Tax=Trichinella nativa TaxID=6335 RepID=A0A1Y3ERK9_9BILA|nr:hypothetical protein D917_08267 [Trichinella nativa]